MNPLKFLPLLLCAVAVLFAAAGCDQPAGNHRCDPFDGVCPLPGQPITAAGYEFSGGNHAAAATVNAHAAAEVKSQTAAEVKRDCSSGTCHLVRPTTCPDCPQLQRPELLRTPAANAPPRPVPIAQGGNLTAEQINRIAGPPPLRPGERLLHVGPGVAPAHVRYPNAQPATAPRPAAAATYQPKVDARGEVIRGGAFSCARCKRATVGAEWHELWADDGTPLTCLCERCWHTIETPERQAYLQQYARGSSRGNLSPVVAAAIFEASK